MLMKQILIPITFSVIRGTPASTLHRDYVVNELEKRGLDIPENVVDCHIGGDFNGKIDYVRYYFVLDKFCIQDIENCHQRLLEAFKEMTKGIDTYSLTRDEQVEGLIQNLLSCLGQPLEGGAIS